MEPTVWQGISVFIGFLIYSIAGLIYDHLRDEAIALSLKKYNYSMTSFRPLLVWLFFTIKAFKRLDIYCGICGSSKYCGGHFGNGELGGGAHIVFFWFFILIGRIVALTVYFIGYFLFYQLERAVDKFVQVASRVKF